MMTANSSKVNEAAKRTGCRVVELCWTRWLVQQERGWINEREEKKPGKGMPHKIYSLKIGLKEIVSRLEKQQRKAAEEASGKIHRLRELPSLSILLSQLLNPFTVSVCRIIQRIFVSVSSTIGSDEAERNNIRTPHIYFH